MSGCLMSAFQNYCSFLGYTKIEDDYFRSTDEHYYYQFEVLYNIVKLCVLCKQYDLAESIVEKYPMFDERKHYADDKDRKNAEDILKINNLYTFSFKDLSCFFVPHINNSGHSLLARVLSTYPSYMKEKERGIIDLDTDSRCYSISFTPPSRHEIHDAVKSIFNVDQELISKG